MQVYTVLYKTYADQSHPISSLYNELIKIISQTKTKYIVMQQIRLLQHKPHCYFNSTCPLQEEIMHVTIE